MKYNSTIVQTAVDIYNAGAHYLWGATGATPGGNEGTMTRPGMVYLADASTDPNAPMIFTARCDINPNKYDSLCTGRFNNPTDAPGVRTANADDWDLVNYLNGLAASDPSSWQPYFGKFSPRITKHSQIVWGEDCNGIQHFDCVGFINYCVEKGLASTKPVAMSIDQWASDSMGATTSAGLNDDPYPADILIQYSDSLGYHHIGLMGVDDSGNATVIQAADTDKGVIYGSYDSGGWQYRRRLSDYFLNNYGTY